MARERWGVRQIAQTSELNGLVERPRWKGRSGYFKESYSPLHWELEPLGIYSVVRGGWVIVFPTSNLPVTHMIGPLSRINPTPLHESWPSTKSSSPGKEFPLSFLIQIQVLTVSEKKAQKLSESSELSSVQSAWQNESLFQKENFGGRALKLVYINYLFWNLSLCAEARLLFCFMRN
jgi:hypothetical protein